jgi:hypothetical protein
LTFVGPFNDAVSDGGSIAWKMPTTFAKRRSGADDWPKRSSIDAHPFIPTLRCLAAEFEAKAVARAAEEASAKAN